MLLSELQTLNESQSFNVVYSGEVENSGHPKISSVDELNSLINEFRSAPAWKNQLQNLVKISKISIGKSDPDEDYRSFKITFIVSSDKDDLELLGNDLSELIWGDKDLGLGDVKISPIKQ